MATSIFLEIKKRYEALSQVEQTTFLIYLLYYLSERARESYVEEPLSCATDLKAYNEMIQVTTKQLLWKTSRENNIGYPDDVFWEVLCEAFEQGNQPVNVLQSVIYDTFREILS